MDKALAETELTEKFTEQDLRAKVGSDAASDFEAMEKLAHTNTNTTKKHYRRRGNLVSPGQGFLDLWEQ